MTQPHITKKNNDFYNKITIVPWSIREINVEIAIYNMKISTQVNMFKSIEEAIIE